MNKKTQTHTDPDSISSGTALHQHYWNNDSTKNWSARELDEASDTSLFRPLLHAGHHLVPKWNDLSCETQLILDGALFRIFNHAPRLHPPKEDLSGVPTAELEGLPPGTLFAVAGVAADSRSAEAVWLAMQDSSGVLFSATREGELLADGTPVAGVAHPGQTPSQPRSLPWLSFMSYDPAYNDNQQVFPDDEHLILWIAKEWLRSRGERAT